MDESFPPLKKIKTSENSFNEPFTLKEKKNAMSIVDLPNEIIFHIFSYLNVDTLLVKVHVVCKHFNNLVEDGSFWKNFKSLSFENSKSISYIKNMIEKCPNVKYLKISPSWLFSYSWLQIDSSLFSALSHLTQLCSFSLHNFKIDSSCECSFRSFVKSLPNLTFLDVSKCYITDKALEAVSEARNLTHLSISESGSIWCNVLRKIFENCSQLEYFSLSANNYSFEGAVCLSELSEYGTFSHLKHLALINLTSFSVYDSTVKTLADTCQELVSLDLEGCKYLCESTVIYVIQTCHKLIFLGLEGLIKLKGDFLMKHDECLKSLKVLNLCHCVNLDVICISNFICLHPEFGQKSGPVKIELETMMDPHFKPLILSSSDMTLYCGRRWRDGYGEYSEEYYCTDSCDNESSEDEAAEDEAAEIEAAEIEAAEIEAAEIEAAEIEAAEIEAAEIEAAEIEAAEDESSCIDKNNDEENDDDDL